MSTNIAITDMLYSITYRSFERQGAGWIEEAGWVRTSHGIPDPRQLPAWQISYVSRGSGWLQSGSVPRVRISAGSWYCLFPGIVHTYAPDHGTTWDEIFFIFNGPIGKFLEQQGLLDRRRPVRSAPSIAFWNQRLTAVLSDAADASAATPALRLAAVISDLACAENESDLADSWLTQAKRLLRPPANGPAPTIAAIARQMDLRPEAFRKRFTRHAHMPPRRWQERCQLERACDLLIADRRTLQDIAGACGFADAFHLSRRFKLVLGVSPRDWRRRFPS